MYLRLAVNSFNNFKMIEDSEDIYSHIDKNKSAYFSPFFYSKEQYEQFKKTKSVSGINDVVTNKLWWDFDCKDQMEVAQKSTAELADRLIKLGFKESDLQIKFSGGKGFHLVVDTDKNMTNEEVKAICAKIAEDLEGFDDRVYLPTQILRLPLTKHNKTNLYARPFKLQDIKDFSIEDIKTIAKTLEKIDETKLNKFYTKAQLSDQVYNYKEYKQKEKEIKQLDTTITFDFNEINFNEKPNFLDNAKYALQKGFFYGSENKAVGDRTNAMLCLAATYKNQGFDKEHTYRILKGVAELQSSRTGEEKFSNVQLWTEIISQVYGPYWKGGQFSVNDPNSWLYKYAIQYNIPRENSVKTKPIKIGDLNSSFKTFVTNIEQNTVKTGIDCIDKAMPITTGMNLGIIGAAGSGKTALALKILENTSKAGVISVFASLDMHRNS